MENINHLIFIQRLAQLYKLLYRKIIILFLLICEQHSNLTQTKYKSECSIPRGFDLSHTRIKELSVESLVNIHKLG